MEKVIFYHAGCPVCQDAEKAVLDLFDRNRYKIEVVHLGEMKARIPEAEAAGVKSVPAFTFRGNVYHINFGASIADLK